MASVPPRGKRPSAKLQQAPAFNQMQVQTNIDLISVEEILRVTPEGQR